MFIRFAERGTAVFYDLCVIVGLLVFIRFAERGTSVFSGLCVIVRVVDVYQICREGNGCVP
jgi:hypothetical protein